MLLQRPRFRNREMQLVKPIEDEYEYEDDIPPGFIQNRKSGPPSLRPVALRAGSRAVGPTLRPVGSGLRAGGGAGSWASRRSRRRGSEMIGSAGNPAASGTGVLELWSIGCT